MVPEGRRLFPSLSVEENLLIGGSSAGRGPWTLERIYELFPILASAAAPRHALSGGQQQMVAIGRALMSNPTLLLCDEISLGLAPIVIQRHLRTPSRDRRRRRVADRRRAGHRAGAVDRRPRLLPAGRPRRAGRRAATLTREQISAAYFGV